VEGGSRKHNPIDGRIPIATEAKIENSKSRMDKAEALRQAALKLLASQLYATPSMGRVCDNRRAR